MLFFDEQLPPKDTLLVLNAVAKLDTTEFKLFELAYVDWYGKACSGQSMEHFFVTYMYESSVPFWVRAFCRKVLAFNGEMNVAQSLFGVGIKKATRGMRVLGLFHGVILLISLLVLIFIFSVPAEQLPVFLKECYFPPCY